MSKLYDKATAEAMPGLEKIWPDETKRRKAALILVAAANYGAGDAMAGVLLKSMTAEFLQGFAAMLEIEDFTVQYGGAHAAMQLLSCRSRNAEVDALLRRLDAAAANGTGV